MPRIHFQVQTEITPGGVLAALTDFTERRAQVWPNIDVAHFKVHGSGAGWADVTEGNSLAGGIWERSRYEWGTTPGMIRTTTLESNTWRPGSGWSYQLKPTPTGGTRIDVTVLLLGRGIKGRTLGITLAFFGAHILRSDMQQVLRRIGSATTA